MHMSRGLPFTSALHDPAILSQLGERLDEDEIDRLGARVERLLRSGRHPGPPHGGRAIPWPAF